MRTLSTTKIADEFNPDYNFEQNLARIAFTSITDRVPFINKHTLGFELLERSENDDRAFGVFAIRIKDIIGFIPIIFTDGHIKGTGFLFLKDDNIFVPFNEDWINFLKFSSDIEIGSAIHKNDRATVSEPDLRKLIVPPTHNKMGSAKKIQKNVEPTTEDRDNFLQAAFGALYFRNTPDVSHLLKFADFRNALKEYGKRYAPFADAFKYFYKQSLEEAIEVAEKNAQLQKLFNHSETKTNTPIKIHPNDKISFITQEKFAELKKFLNANLTEEEKTELIKKKYIVKDARDPKEITVIINKAPEQFIVANEPGVYEVLMEDGSWKEIIILKQKKVSSSLYDNKSFIYADPQEQSIIATWKINDRSPALLVRKCETYKTQEQAPETFQKWFKSLKKINEYLAAEKEPKRNEIISDQFAIVTDEMDVFIPDFESIVTVAPEYTSDTHPVYIIGNIIYIKPDRVRITDIKDARKMIFSQEKPQNRSGLIIDLGGKRVADEKTAEDWMKKHYGNIKIAKDGLEVWVNNQSFQPIEAIIHLVKTHGLSEKDAAALVKKAMISRDEIIRVTVKYGEDYPYLTPGPNAPAFPQFEYPSLADRLGNYDINPRIIVSLLADDVKNYRDHDPTKYLPYPEYMEDPLASHLAQIAKQTGLKTIFDTSAIYAIIKQPLSHELIHELVVYGIKTMTKIASMLIRIWWHRTDIENQFYSQNKLVEIETDLQNCFDSLGKLILEIKKLIK